MIDNQELASELRRITRALEAASEARQAVVAPLDVPPWPTSDTQTQGFLAARWQRRDGNVYGGPAARDVPGPNSAIRGGDDASAKVSVPSGVRRV